MAAALCLSILMKWISSPTSLVLLATWLESNSHDVGNALQTSRILPRLIFSKECPFLMRHVQLFVKSCTLSPHCWRADPGVSLWYQPSYKTRYEINTIATLTCAVRAQSPSSALYLHVPLVILASADEAKRVPVHSPFIVWAATAHVW